MDVTSLVNLFQKEFKSCMAAKLTSPVKWDTTTHLKTVLSLGLVLIVASPGQESNNMHDILIEIDIASNWCHVTVDKKLMFVGHSSDVLQIDEFLARIQNSANLHEVTLSDIRIEYANFRPTKELS